MVFGLFKKKPKQDNAPRSRHRWVVRKVVQQTHDTIAVVLDPGDDKATYEPGQFLTVDVQIDGRSVKRPYSLCSSPAVDPYPAIAIKRVYNGLASNHLLNTLREGDVLTVMPPKGRFVVHCDAQARRHFVMFAGGVGVTPLLSILKSVMVQEPQSVVSLLYANRTARDIIFKDELRQLQAAYRERALIRYALDDPPANWDGYRGLLNEEMLSAFMDALPDLGASATHYLMCGPYGMMQNVERLMALRNVDKERIKRESFAPKVRDKIVEDPPAEASATSRQVTVHHDGARYTFCVKAESAILEAALDEGIDLPFSCQNGICTACRGKLLSGKVDIDADNALSDEERKEGYTLTCIGRPLTDDVVIEIG